MNDDVMGGMWKQIKGSVKSAFGALTDDDLTEVEGDSDRMLGKLQERYGYSRADAERAWNDFKNGLNRDSDRAAAERHMDHAEDKAEDAIDEAKKGLRRALD
jgi:uncharacterized protein YjbJ (UPF0337 family)